MQVDHFRYLVLRAHQLIEKVIVLTLVSLVEGHLIAVFTNEKDFASLERLKQGVGDGILFHSLS